MIFYFFPFNSTSTAKEVNERSLFHGPVELKFIFSRTHTLFIYSPKFHFSSLQSLFDLFYN